MAPDTQAPAEYLKHPGRLATTVFARSEPPIIAPAGSNGDASLTSTTNPTFLLVLFQTTLVPTLTQKIEFPFAPGILGVAEVESDVRFTSTTQGVVGDPQVLAGVHIEAGFGSEQAYLALGFLSSAMAEFTTRANGRSNPAHRIVEKL